LSKLKIVRKAFENFGRVHSTLEKDRNLTSTLIQFCSTNSMTMETRHTGNTGSSMLLTGCIFLANLDFTGLLDYAVKALIGGGIWLGYKMTADYIERKRNRAK